MKQLVNLKVNGSIETVHVEPWKSLADVLREELGITSVKIGCNEGQCGTCTILLDGKAVKSCMILAPQAEGRDIVTIEGLAAEGELHPLQEAFIEHFAVQCGYCIPGMILASKALLDENPDASETEVREALHGNLCRCTGYVKIVEAVMVARDKLRRIGSGERSKQESPMPRHENQSTV